MTDVVDVPAVSEDLPRVLIIEDYPSASIGLTAQFRRIGWEPIPLSDGYRAVEYINSGAKSPEAVLVDLLLPGPSGVELIKLIRACKVMSPKTGGPVRIVAYTGCEAKNESVVQARKYGADAVLLKPAAFDKTLSVLTGDHPGDIDLITGEIINDTTSSKPEVRPGIA